MMNQDEWLGTLRYAGKAQDKVSLDTLMLRYRPIAPKPTTGQPCDAGDNNKNSYNLSKRTKRKYVRVSKNNSTTCRGKTRSDLSDDREPTGVVTLQLMPEKSDLTSDCTPSDPMVKTITGEETRETNTWTMFNGGVTAEVETWVTVESATGVYDGSSSFQAVECTDAEIVDNLSKDTCPAFVSDASNRVVWVNEAYRRNVSGEDPSSLSSLPDVTSCQGSDRRLDFCLEPYSRCFSVDQRRIMEQYLICIIIAVINPHSQSVSSSRSTEILGFTNHPEVSFKCELELGS
ncbi:unnamed protein product [Brassica oleracea var. botrytis]